MNKHIVVRTPIDIDYYSTWAKQVDVRKCFYDQLTEAQRDFIKSIFSWYVDFDKYGRNAVLELTVLNEKQATLARMIF